MVQNARHSHVTAYTLSPSKHLSFSCYRSMHLHISANTFPMHQHLYNIMAPHICPFFGEGEKKVLNAALNLQADLWL